MNARQLLHKVLLCTSVSLPLALRCSGLAEVPKAGNSCTTRSTTLTQAYTDACAKIVTYPDYWKGGV